MIAPIRDPDPADNRSRGHLVAAEQHASAVALAHGGPGRAVKPIAKPRAWAFVAWTLGVAASYFAMRSWWTLRE